MDDNQPRGAHLVGSVPLKDAASVYAMAGSLLGEHLRRMPDGETGDRANWVRWQLPVLERSAQLEPVSGDGAYGTTTTQMTVRDGATHVELGPLGYSRAAIASYQEFRSQKQAGLIPASCRFQISLPTPLAPVQIYVSEESRARVEPFYEAALMAELREILNVIPNDELAIQWDTAVEFGILEGVFPTFLEDRESEILSRLVRIGNAVPRPVELGYHLCYGDSEHKHFVDPKDCARLVQVANGLATELERFLTWVHMPVPRDRVDPGFFAPLRELELHPRTELYLGLVHMTDGAEGARRRIESAKSARSRFGVATECGFGRRPPETVESLLKIHREVAHPAL